jgi:hypothetical protein
MNCMRLWIIKQSKNIQLEVKQICEFHYFVHHQQAGDIKYTKHCLWIINLKVQSIFFEAIKRQIDTKKKSTSWIVLKSSSIWLIKRSCKSKKKDLNCEYKSKLDYYSKLKNLDFGCDHQNQMRFMANLHPSLLSFTHLMNSLDHVWCWWETEILFKVAKGFNTQMEIDMFWDVYEEKRGHNFPKRSFHGAPLINSSIIKTWKQLALLSWQCWSCFHC